MEIVTRNYDDRYVLSWWGNIIRSVVSDKFLDRSLSRKEDKYLNPGPVNMLPCGWRWLYQVQTCQVSIQR